MVRKNQNDQSVTPYNNAYLRSCVYIPANNMDVPTRLNKDIEKIDNDIVRKQASLFSDTLCQHLNRSNLNNLPPMYYSNDEGDAFFEWIFDNFRFGFLFCKDIEESGWFLVSKVNGKNERMNSTFDGNDTVKFICSYIEMNA